MGEDVTSAGVDAGPLGRFEQRSAVSEFGSAGWPFDSAAPAIEELVREAGCGHAGDVAGPPELAPEDLRLDGVDCGVGGGGGVGDGSF